MVGAVGRLAPNVRFATVSSVNDCRDFNVEPNASQTTNHSEAIMIHARSGSGRNLERLDGTPERAPVIPFRRRGGTTRWSPIRDPLRQQEEVEDRLRMRQNMAAAVVLIVLFMASVWVADELNASARTEVCIEAGHTDCAPLMSGRVGQSGLEK